MIVLLIYTALFVPYKVCFMDGGSDFMFWLDCFIDSLFFTDIVLSFFTVTEDEFG